MAALQDDKATSPLERSVGVTLAETGGLVATDARQEPSAGVTAETGGLVATGASQRLSVGGTLDLVETAVRAKACHKDTTGGQAKSKAKAKDKAKAKGKAKASVKSTTAGKVVGGKGKAEALVKSSKAKAEVVKVLEKAKAVNKAARIDHEASRQQYLVRCSGEKSQQFPYKDGSARSRALKAAKKHCIELCALHGLEIPVSAT